MTGPPPATPPAGPAGDRGPGEGPRPDPPAATPAGMWFGRTDMGFEAVPADLAARVRRRARRLRVLRTGALVASAAVIAAAAALLPASGPGGSPRPDDVRVVEPLPAPPAPAPDVPVGVGGVTWVSDDEVGHDAVWCVGGRRGPGAVGVIQSCRYLPLAGALDVVALDAGVLAPPGRSLVVAILTGLTRTGMPVRASLRDTGGARDLTLAQPPGMPGVVVFWGYTSGGRRDIRVEGADGGELASCRACAGAGA